MIYDVKDKISDELDSVMQVKYEKFCMAELANTRLKIERLNKELERVNDELKEAQGKAYKIKNDSNYCKELYHEKRRDIQQQVTKSQYIRDLHEIANSTV